MLCPLRLITSIVPQAKPQSRLTEVTEAIRLLGRDHSTGVGLVMFGADQGKAVPMPSREVNPGMFKRAWSRLAEMF